MNIFDIARLAGVSRKTVQRVLSDSPSVKPETKEKILRIMAEHHYEPSEVARNLSAKRTRTIGIFLIQNRDVYEMHTDDLFFGAVIGGIVNQCGAMNYKALVTTVDISNPDPLYSVYKQRAIDLGIILTWSNVREIVEHVKNAGFMVAVFDQNNIFPQLENIPYPRLDNRTSAAKAAEYLLDLGHTDIAIITGEMFISAAVERLEGFLSAVLSRGLEVPEHRIFYGRFLEETGMAAVEQWVAENNLPQAIFCSNDLIAYGVLKALHQHHISVPDQVSIIGYDDLLVSQYMQPPLTTMKIPRVEMAEFLTAQMIQSFEEGQEPKIEQRIFTAELVERQTCKSLN